MNNFDNLIEEGQPPPYSQRVLKNRNKAKNAIIYFTLLVLFTFIVSTNIYLVCINFFIKNILENLESTNKNLACNYYYHIGADKYDRYYHWYINNC